MPTDERQRHRARRIRQPVHGAADDLGAGHRTRWTSRIADLGRLEQARVHRGARRIQRSRALDHYLNALDQRAHARQPARQRSTRSTTTCCGRRMLQQRMSASTTRSAAASRSSIRPTTSARSRPRRFRRTTASSCRSRSPASATSRRSTARSAACPAVSRQAASTRWRATILVTGAAGFAGSHLLDLLARRRRRRRRLASARTIAPARDVPVDAMGGGRSARSRTRSRAAIARLRPVGRLSLRRRRPCRPGVGLDRVDVRDQRARHASPAAARSSAPATPRAC